MIAVPGLPPKKRGTLKGLEKEEKDENMVKSNRSGAYDGFILALTDVENEDKDKMTMLELGIEYIYGNFPTISPHFKTLDRHSTLNRFCHHLGTLA